MRYRVIFSREAIDQLRSFTVREQALVLDPIEVQLLHEPGVETRRRKRMRPNSIAPWELRLGELRVFYDFKEAATQVQVIAVGRKQGNRFWLASKEIDL